MTRLRLFKDFSLRPVIRRASQAPIGRTHVLLPSAFLVALGLNILGFGIVFYMADTFAVGTGQIGLISAVWNCCYFCGCLFLRPLGNRILPRFSLMLAAGSMALWLTLIIIIGSPGMTFLFYGLAGLSNSLFFPPMMTWLATGLEGKELNRTMSQYSFSWSLGGTVSPYIAGFLVEMKPVYALYACISLLLITLILIAITSVTVRGMRTVDQPSEGIEGVVTEEGTPLRFVYWFGIYSMYVLLGLMGVVFPLYARGSLQMKESMIGIILLLRSLVVTMVFLFLGKHIFWHNNRRFVLLLQTGLTVLCVLMILLRSTILLFILVPLQGIFYAAFYSGSVFHGALGTKEKQMRMAIHESILTAGNITGAVVGGILFEVFGFGAAFAMPAILAFLVTIGMAAFLIKYRQ